MSDKLRMDYINSLPQPFLVRFCGDKEWWPVESFEVGCALVRIDVCGKLQVKSFGEVMQIKDGSNTIHDPDTFYTDYEEVPMQDTLPVTTKKLFFRWEKSPPGRWTPAYYHNEKPTKMYGSEPAHGNWFEVPLELPYFDPATRIMDYSIVELAHAMLKEGQMADKLFIRKVSVTRTYYETAMAYAERGIQTSNIRAREIPNSHKVQVHEDWREATEPEAILAGGSISFNSDAEED